MRTVLAILLVICALRPLSAQEDLRLAVPGALEKSGFAQFLVPRFVLKTGVRITRVGEDEAAQMRFTTDGRALFEGLGERWALAHEGGAGAERFADWLRSDIGLRTIESFVAPDGSRFSTQIKAAAIAPVLNYDGDPVKGEQLSLRMCGRCHVINEKNRMNGMGATPSFAVLRTLSDWDDRFATFHLRNPHPSFTQIEDITDPFDPSLPSPIVPMEMTQADLEAIVAYVSGLPPADLGDPLQTQ
ncbi:cytochrome c [Roseobacter sp. YSTF-M11]|uniref:Cytochrome c n=1 Tax=Roseobacter insulae TaxID=2859783 RepID=A0A9X1K2A9_9RHOB|nr:cytochrome c [Roseobacter insulae]MBW4710054.1 cytochrome c [Roseobacter insulae]